jgi:actin-related protein
LSYPIEHGIVQNWADMERIWSYVYSKDQLNVPSDEHAVSYLANCILGVSEMEWISGVADRGAFESNFE